jgi:hypothetical protein
MYFQIWQISHEMHEYLSQNYPGWIGHGHEAPRRMPSSGVWRRVDVVD